MLNRMIIPIISLDEEMGLVESEAHFIGPILPTELVRSSYSLSMRENALLVPWTPGGRSTRSGRSSASSSSSSSSSSCQDQPGPSGTKTRKR